MKKLLIHIVILMVICGGLIQLANYLLTNYNGHYTYKMLEEMYNCEDNIDILFVGSSHVYRSYDPQIVTHILSEKAFNAGSSSQLLDHSYYMLKEVAKTNDIHTVYLDTYYSVASVSSSKDQWSVYILTDYMKNSFNKLDFLYQSGRGKTVLNGYISVRRNIENLDLLDNLASRNIALEDYSTVTFDNEEYRGDGFVYSFDTIDIETADFNRRCVCLTDEIPMSEFSYEYIIKIIRFCKENGIELVLVDQPMPVELLDSIEGYDNYVAFLYELAETYDIEYLNFNCYKGEMSLTLDDYKDEDHLNGRGAEAYTRLFCDTVKSINLEEVSREDLFSNAYTEVR